ncbi:MAG: hypothetical protein EZS26_000323 [Candidatus Ordinivivax streblomastigis]|uniref:Mannosyltransferase involved in polysaccharide biosynthesis n=1 Tax=Candidatus Ordinivivax streblomastigis TaxID=2540710 RepID=A0A5M8P639_9BACT|nr:MAG: hypothetical protein EZS26_000323 [Candidatus Ordinivivax streblomastigis]
MIPKIIHYCWFGQKPFPELEKQCIESWKKYLPDYELKMWNEQIFDIKSIPYVQQAYENGKYAFVSDYVRMHALYHYGGIYLDTDVEILKSLDIFLQNEVFMGFENRTMLGTAVIGAVKNYNVFSEIMNYYQQRDFINNKHQQDTTANPQILVDVLLKYGFKKENSEQFINGIHIYERDIFLPKKLNDGTYRSSERTVSIHHFSGSWLSERDKKRGTNRFWIEVCRPMLRQIRLLSLKIFGENYTKQVEIKVRNKLR